MEDSPEKVNVGERRVGEECESEGSELERGWIFTVIASNSFIFQKMICWL